MVRKDPDHARSYYEQLALAKGGIKGSRERKEKAITTMLEAGVLVRIELEAPKGRANHFIRVDEVVISSQEKSKYAR